MTPIANGPSAHGGIKRNEFDYASAVIGPRRRDVTAAAPSAESAKLYQLVSQRVPGAGELRRMLLQTALARLQKVSDQFASRSAIDHNTAAALIDLGDVFLRVGQASSLPDQASLSNTDGPLAAQQAFDIAQQLAAADPSDAQAQRDLSISYSRLGDEQDQ
jgi:hypothetical protein